MNSFIYRYPIEIRNEMNSILPNRITWGTQCEYDPEMYVLYKEVLDRFVASGVNLNSLTQQLYGMPFDEKFDQYKLYNFKIYDFLLIPSERDPFEVPKDVDFKTDLKIKLQKKTLPKIQGKPTSVEYYEKKYIQTDENGIVYDSNGQPVIIYENLICRVDFTLVYDPVGFIIQKVALLNWYRTDGTFESANAKDIGELFDPILDHEKRISEGKMRREAIVDGLQLPALSFLTAFYPDKNSLELLTIGRDFLNRYDEDFRDFIEKSLSVSDPLDPNYGKKVIVVKIQEATDVWLDMPLGGGFTPRLFIINELSTS